MTFGSNPFLPDGVVLPPPATGQYATENYSIEYTGFLKVPTDGVYALFTTSDDGSFFAIGDPNGSITVVRNNFSQGPVERTGNIALSAGMHRFSVQYGEGNGGNSLSEVSRGS